MNDISETVRTRRASLLEDARASTTYGDLDTELEAFLSESACSDRVVESRGEQIDTPEQLMMFAAEGQLPKAVLARLLAPRYRHDFLKACAAVEMALTDRCGDCQVGSGCAQEGEACLAAVLNASTDYYKACAAEWLKVFIEPDKRIGPWRT